MSGPTDEWERRHLLDAWLDTFKPRAQPPPTDDERDDDERDEDAAGE